MSSFGLDRNVLYSWTPKGGQLAVDSDEREGVEASGSAGAVRADVLEARDEDRGSQFAAG